MFLFGYIERAWTTLGRGRVAADRAGAVSLARRLTPEACAVRLLLRGRPVSVCAE